MAQKTYGALDQIGKTDSILVRGSFMTLASVSVA